MSTKQYTCISKDCQTVVVSNTIGKSGSSSFAFIAAHDFYWQYSWEVMLVPGTIIYIIVQNAHMNGVSAVTTTTHLL